MASYPLIMITLGEYSVQNVVDDMNKAEEEAK